MIKRKLITGNEVSVLVFVLVLVSLAVEFEMTFKMKSLTPKMAVPSRRKYQQKLNSGNNNNSDSSKSGGEGESLKKKETMVNMRQIDLFLKQLTRAHRFERNATLRRVMAQIAKRVSRFNNRQGVTTEKRPRSSVTIILNAVNEITDLGVFFQCLQDNNSSIDQWHKGTKILLGLSQDTYEKHSKTINNLPTETLKHVIVPKGQHQPLVKTLAYLVANATTEHVLLARHVRFIGHDFDIDEFARPLLENGVDVVVASQVLPGSRWSTGCYQSKLIWSQFKTQYGADSIDLRKEITSNSRKSGSLWMRCDFFDGPFAMKKNLLLDYLQNRMESRCSDQLLYLEIIYVMNNMGKLMKVHPSTIFHMQQGGGAGGGGTLATLTRNDWKDFAIRNEISEVIIKTTTEKTRNNNDGGGIIIETKIHHEFDHGTLKSKCINKANMLRPRDCMRDLHFMLVNSYRLFDKYGYGYTNEDGSGLAAVKLHDTLPWDLDQDFAFRADDLLDLVKHESEFKKHGMHFNLQINKKCLAEKNPKIFQCSYIGVADRLWNIELWGQHMLLGDLYQPWKLPTEYKHLFPDNRIHGNDTKVRIGDYWCPNRPNPGYYVRGRYGVDVLRHAKHWRQGGAPASMGIYSTSRASRFGPCPIEGHHRCMNQYLSDGNIQFQRVWA